MLNGWNRWYYWKVAICWIFYKHWQFVKWNTFTNCFFTFRYPNKIKWRNAGCLSKKQMKSEQKTYAFVLIPNQKWGLKSIFSLHQNPEGICKVHQHYKNDKTGVFLSIYRKSDKKLYINGSFLKVFDSCWKIHCVKWIAITQLDKYSL